MASWRMAFRNGDTGSSFWSKCQQLGVAAISYYPLGNIDLSRVSPAQFKDLAEPLAPTQKASLRRVRYEMKPGDVIYVKEGPRIVGKGIVKGAYHFDKRHRIRDDNGNRWSHQVPVDWVKFPAVPIKVGTEPRQTVARLSARDVEVVEDAARASRTVPQPLNGTPSTRRWWVCKCNNTRHENQVAYGDWADLFKHTRPMKWGSTEWVPDLARLTQGDLVIATQTERNELVGLASVEKPRYRKRWKNVYLLPRKRIGRKLRPLKKANARIAQIPALQPGPIQTIYEISEKDATLLLQAAGFDPSDLANQRATADDANADHERAFEEGEKSLIKGIRRTRSTKLRNEAKRHWGTKCYCCGFDFGEFYGSRAKGYIQVHHHKLISAARRQAKNTVDDVQVVCANCHVVIHLKPPMDADELRAELKKRKRKVTIEAEIGQKAG